MAELNINVLVLLGLALFLGTIGGELSKKLKAPGIVGFILAGVFIGQSGLGFIDSQALQALRPFNHFALALIGFTIGGELRRDVLKKYGKSLFKILTFEGAGAFISVFLLTAICGLLLFGDLKTALVPALLLGAIGSATDPASPANIITETKSRGPLSTNVLGIVALDDGFAVVLFALTSSIAGKIMNHGAAGNPLLTPAYEIIGAAAIGIAAGGALSLILDRATSGEGLAGLALGMIILTAGLSIAARTDMILAVMTFGVTTVNLRPEKSRRIFRLVRSATGPIFVLFFVLVGASMDVKSIAPGSLLLAAAYISGTAAGKISGAKLGAKISGAPRSVYLYLPYCLFSQAGVAVGLTILAAQNFPGQIGTSIVATVTPAVFILQLISPLITKTALVKSGETGLNITEKDLLENVPAGELAGQPLPRVHEDTSLAEILRLFSAGENLYYPVVSRAGKLLGIISVEGIKSALAERELSDMLLAFDIMEPAPEAVEEDISLAEARETMAKLGTDYIPVIDTSRNLKGFIEERMLKKFVSSRLLDMKRKITELEKERPGHENFS